jgi:hypothetical protein
VAYPVAGCLAILGAVAGHASAGISRSDLKERRGDGCLVRLTSIPKTAALGPISYLIVEFPDNKMTGEGFATLLDLVDRGVIRILDLMFVRRDSDGSIRALELQDIDHDGQFDLAVFAGASSGLLGESDLSETASVIEPGSSAGILIFENRWATPFIQALRRGQAELVAAGYIPQDDLVAALDAAES